VRFTVAKLSTGYRVVYDFYKIVGYVARGSGRLCHISDKNHRVIKADIQGGMRKAFREFITYLESSL
jgi:hypothetical protein